MASNGEGAEAIEGLFMTLPIEIQEKIAKMLTDYKDVENVCVAYPHLLCYDPLNNWFQDMKTVQVTKKVFDILLHKKYLDKEDALKSRLISKTWKESVDEHYRTANIHSVTFEGGSSYRYPRHVICVPVTEHFPTRLNLMGNHGGNPFVGNRLMLKCGQTEATTQMRSQASLIQSFQVAHVWKHVQHLEIVENGETGVDSDDDDDERDAILRRIRCAKLLRPFLKMMSNVKTIKFNLRDVSTFQVLRAMPALATLEQLIVSTPCDYDDDDDKEKLLKACSSSLKLLSWSIALDQQVSFDSFKFPHLQEFSITDGMMEVSEYSRKRIGRIFPAVRVLGIEFNGDPESYDDFVDTFNKFSAVEQAVISCRYKNHKSGKYRISEHVHGPDASRVRRGLHKIEIVNVGNSWDRMKFKTIVCNFGALLETGDKCKIVSNDEPAYDDDNDLDWLGTYFISL